MMIVGTCCLLVTVLLSGAYTDVLTITSKGCTIRGFPQVTNDIEHLVYRPQSIKNCSQNLKLVDSNRTHIWIIDEALDLFNIRYKQEFYCCYRHFNPTYINNVKYSECVEFLTTVKVKHNFLHVKCYYLDDKIYEDFFAFVQIELSETTSQGDNGQYSVLMLGIESMSRIHFRRIMKSTAEYLHMKGAVEFLGYNKLGDNSFPNLFPILFGDYYENVRRSCFEKYRFKYDDCHFIWDKFKDAGYVTALGADSIAGLLGEYEYSFTRTPTNFYLQPFMFETRHLFRNMHYSYHQCLGSRYFYKVMLDYVKELTIQLKKYKLFGIFWEESVSHEDLNNPHIMDADYLNLLIYLESKNYLDNTVVIFFSDHGMRWGPIVETEQGRLEERLPLLQVLLPSSFKDRYREAFSNFQENSHRLITALDIYETLNDLTNLTSLEDKHIKIRTNHSSLQKSSLFLPISDMRTCESVGIEMHWCTCYRGKTLKISNSNRKVAADTLVSHINELLRPYPVCHQLSINKINHVSMLRNGDSRVYTVVVETYPGRAILDGTLIRIKNHWTISGTVSRLNLYRNNSCIDNNEAKMYCYC